jgi:hypothetical protein
LFNIGTAAYVIHMNKLEEIKYIISVDTESLLKDQHNLLKTSRKLGTERTFLT